MDVAHDKLSETVIGCAYTVANTLGHGFVEKVYENALLHEMTKAGMHCKSQHKMQVIYDGVVVGEFVADMLVEDTILVEVKAVKKLTDLLPNMRQVPGSSNVRKQLMTLNRDPAIRKEKSAEADYVRLMKKLEKTKTANARQRPARDFEIAAKRHDGTTFGELAAEQAEELRDEAEEED